MNKRYHFLILEDNPFDAELTLHQLNLYFNEFDYDLVSTEEGYRQALEKQPDIVLADYALPQFDALKALKILEDVERDIPLVIISGTIGEDVAVEAMRKGAYDYLIKDRLTRLGQSIEHAVQEAEMRKENRRAQQIIKEDELRYRSLFDDSPNSLWEEDFSAIKTRLDELTQQGIHDFEKFFTEHPEELWNIIQLRKILDVNKVTLQMYCGRDDKRNLRELGLLFSEESLVEFKKQLLCFISGDTHYHCETVHKTGNGKYIFVSVHASIVPGYEDSWKKVYTSIVDISDRKEAEKQIQNSERLLRAVIDRSPDWIFIKDRQHRYKLANQTFAKAIDLTPEEILGKTDEEIGYDLKSIHGDPESDFYGFLSNDDKVWETGQSVNSYAVEVFHTNGKSWVFDSVKVPFELGESKEPVLLGISHDITDRVQVQRALAENQELLQTIINSNPSLIWVLDEDCRFKMANKAVGILFRLEPAEVIGLTNLELAERGVLSLEDALNFHERVCEVLRTETAINRFEHSVTDQQGQVHWLQTSILLLKQDSQQRMVLGVSTDISETVFAAQELAAVNATLEQRVEERTITLEKARQDLEYANNQIGIILNNSQDGILLLDKEANVLLANPALCKMVGKSAQQIIGMSYFEWSQAETRELHKKNVYTVLEKNEIYYHEYRSIRPDGISRDRSVTLSPVFQEGEMIAIVATIHDISQQKELQRMKDAFVSNVSHELRTPITNFICNLELIRRKPENQEAYLKRLDQEAEQLRTLIEDLLRLSRLDQNAVYLEKRSLNLNLLCSDFIMMRSTLAEQKEIEMKFVPAENISNAYADLGLVTQVLSILITNALNYTPRNRTIEIHTLQGSGDKAGFVGFSVSDNGPGIQPEEHNRVFQRFYRGDAGLQSNVPGTGLGLSIAHEIVQRHKGEILLKSAGVDGAGTTFTVLLPIAPKTTSSI